MQFSECLGCTWPGRTPRLVLTVPESLLTPALELKPLQLSCPYLKIMTGRFYTTKTRERKRKEEKVEEGEKKKDFNEHEKPAAFSEMQHIHTHFAAYRQI
jgi:hypothetical protein